jgi:hypothetical protein
MNEKIGRWHLGDFARSRATGKVYEVVGFILSPAVCFRELRQIGHGEERVEVADCPNELRDLEQFIYQRGPLERLP